jgi:hypothetical protein
MTTTANTRSAITNGHIINKDELHQAVRDCGFDLYSSKVAEHLVEEIIRAGWDIESAHRTMIVESASLASYSEKIKNEIATDLRPSSADWVLNPATRIAKAYAEWETAVQSISKNIYALRLVIGFEDVDLGDEIDLDNMVTPADAFMTDLRAICFGPRP